MMLIFLDSLLSVIFLTSAVLLEPLQLDFPQPSLLAVYLVPQFLYWTLVVVPQPTEVCYYSFLLSDIPNVMGNPGISQGNPYLYLWKPIPTITGKVGVIHFLWMSGDVQNRKAISLFSKIHGQSTFIYTFSKQNVLKIVQGT